MERLVFATNNANKLKEVKRLLPEFEIVGLEEAGIHEDIPETAETLAGNAKLKSTYIKEKYGLNCFSDDTGLEVDALNGAPGVYSARYAGGDRDPNKNMDKVLSELKGNQDRKARFKTVISLIMPTDEASKGEVQFEGVVEGEITLEKSGSEGFGYDPIFMPTGYDRTFSEMTMEEKNEISHRGRAVQKLVAYLKTR